MYEFGTSKSNCCCFSAFFFFFEVVCCESDPFPDSINSARCVVYVRLFVLFCFCKLFSDFTVFHCSPKERPSPGSNALKIIYELSVSNKPVNCFDWSPDRAGLAVCSSFDKTLRVIASINLPLGQ